MAESIRRWNLPPELEAERKEWIRVTLREFNEVLKSGVMMYLAAAGVWNAVNASIEKFQKKQAFEIEYCDSRGSAPSGSMICRVDPKRMVLTIPPSVGIADQTERFEITFRNPGLDGMMTDKDYGESYFLTEKIASPPPAPKLVRESRIPRDKEIR